MLQHDRPHRTRMAPVLLDVIAGFEADAGLNEADLVARLHAAISHWRHPHRLFARYCGRPPAPLF